MDAFPYPVAGLLLAVLILPVSAQDRLDVRPPPEARVPEPPAAAQKDAEARIRDQFREDYAKTAPAERALLASKLLLHGVQSQDDLAVQYVSLREARDLAAGAGNAEIALNAVLALERRFDFDVIEMKRAALAASARATQTPEDAGLLTMYYLLLVDDALAADRYDTAKALVAEADAAARKFPNPQSLADVRARAKEVGEICREHPFVQGAEATLAANPEDPAANLSVGRFRCFICGDWDRGLPLLAKGSDPALKALAALDLARPAEPDRQAEIGDGWWDLAGREFNAVKKKRFQARARHWYEQAAPGLSEPLKSRVNGRRK